MTHADESTAGPERAGTMSSSPDDAPGAPPPQARKARKARETREPREDRRPRPILHKALTAASGTCLSVGAGLTLVPVIAHLMPLLGARFVALLGGSLPGRERDFFLSGLGILLSSTIILVMQLWVRRDTHAMSSMGTAELGINLLDLFALACPTLTLVKLYPAHNLGACLLITGSILMTAGIVLLPPRPLAWPPPDDEGRSPLHRLAGTLRSPRLRICAATSTGLVVLTIISTLLYSALAPPTRAFSASLSHPSGGGPDLIAHTSDSGTWATEFKYSHFIDYTVTAAGPIALSVPEKDEKDDKDSVSSAMSTYKPGRLTTQAITLLDPVDGAPHWSLELTNLVGRSTDQPSRSFPNEDSPVIGSAVTDPDGALLAIHLDSTWNESASQWITPIAVIDLTSGRAVGSAEIQGKILGTVLTSDTLAVQVANDSALEPGGTILTYSLNGENGPARPQGSAKVSTWLVGATRDRLLLSDQSLHGIEQERAATVTLATPARVDEVSTIDGVYSILPGGWVERLTSPGQTFPEPLDSDYLDQQDRELVDLSTDHRIDITGMKATLLDTNTGHRLEMTREDPGSSNKTPVGVIDISTPATGTPAIETSDSFLLVTDDPIYSYTDSMVNEVSQPHPDLYAIRRGADS